MLVFGGTAGKKSFFNDLWILDLENFTWTEANLTFLPAPSPRCSHSASVYVFGGLSPPQDSSDKKMQIQSDVWVLHVSNQTNTVH